jgi:phage/plasmid-associated DNA primase
MAKAFGQYYYEPGQTLFSNRGVTGTCLSSEMAKLAGKRVCMTSETEAAADNKLRVGLLKQCTGYDLIQARDIYCTASEFRCVANIIMMFNEVPGCDDSSGGMARRLEFIDYFKKYVENPNAQNRHELQIDNTLTAKFDSSAYGAAFIAYLIGVFNSTGFKIQVPASVKNASTEYIQDNSGIDEFIAEAFDRTDDVNDTVYLAEAFDICKKLKYHELLGVKRKQDLSSKMKMKNIRTCREAGRERRTIFTHLKVKPEIQALLAPEPTRGYLNPHRVPVSAPVAVAAQAFPFILDNNEPEPEMFDYVN